MAMTPLDTMPFATVIIPVLNERDHIAQCLDSVLAQEPLVEGAVEILIVDGLSDDGTREIIRRYAGEHPSIRMLDNPERIQAVGLNTAIRAAQGRIILRMDAHTDYSLDYVRQCVECLTVSSAECVGGAARTKSFGYIGEAVRLAYHSPFAVGPIKFHRPDYEGYVDTVPYGCWKKSTLLELGLYDEGLARAEDHELNLRLTRSGKRILQSPRIRSWYYPRRSFQELFTQYMQYGYWKFKVLQKHKRPASLRHVVPILFITALLAGVFLGLFDPRFWVVPTLILSAYLTMILVGSVVICRSTDNRRYFPVMPITLACYHFAYGIGSLVGLVDFFILRRPPRKSFQGLTRRRRVSQANK